jgi:membrane-associated protease RseP (regulator of RpoE activity)
LDQPQTPDRPDGLTPAAEPPVDDAQLTPRAWLARNGPTLVFLAGLVALVAWKFGLEGSWNIAKVALGLSLVIFIHELGHFAVAKWCDVHVQTFSIGFGPALPGCSFRRGETTYKLALIPLGGYVKMVGEGGENDEEDTDPRSFKNKTVGQRMAIISAGVVMNVLLGLVCFIAAFKSGVHQTAGVVGVVEAGGPAWTKGMPTGAILDQVGDVRHPYFEDLKVQVMLSGPGEQLLFVFNQPGQEPRTVEVVPRKSKNDPNPLIGVSWPFELKLAEKWGDGRPVPVILNSPAAAARVLDLRPGDRVLATTDPEHPSELKELSAPTPGETFNYGELAERLVLLSDKPIRLKVQRKGAAGAEEVEAAPVGFQPEDAVVGTTDDEANNLGPMHFLVQSLSAQGLAAAGAPMGTLAQLLAAAGVMNSDAFTLANDPFQVKPLPPDPRDPDGHHLDYFEYLRRMHRLADRPAVIQVRRKGAGADGPAVPVFVPPAFRRTIPGLVMEMGMVAAVRDGSSAAKKGVEVHDTIKEVVLSDGHDRVAFAAHPRRPDERPLDPLRLPDELRRWTKGRSGVKADLRVQRLDPRTGQADAQQELHGLPWDDSWRYDEELPLGLNSPLAIPELGLAYHVKTSVELVEPGSYAEKKGLRKGDVILEVTVRERAREPGFWARLFGRSAPPPGSTEWAREPFKLWSEGASSHAADDQKPELRWAGLSYRLQEADYPQLRLKVRRDSGATEDLEVELQPDRGWPTVDPRAVRGLPMQMPQDRIARAGSMAEAVQMGFNHTSRTIVQIYMSLKSLLTGRVSATENLQGPIDIAVIAYHTAGQPWADLALLLGIISINLAVVNFLPIPILDGGHMVFLVYEKLRGRPASEAVRLAANWFGLLVLVSLMIFVIYLGVERYIFK